MHGMALHGIALHEMARPFFGLPATGPEARFGAAHPFRVANVRVIHLRIVTISPMSG
jgi:hypothetical protein